MINSSLWVNLHKIYFIVMLPIVLSLVFLTPPFQVPDESRHFLRTIQIASGQLIAVSNSKGEVGGEISLSVQKIIKSTGYHESNGHPDALLDTSINHNAVTWSQDKSFVAFPGAAIYCFLAYLPSVLGILIGKLLGMSVMGTLYVGRLCNGLISIVLSTLAIKFISRGKCLAFALLSLPMTLFEYASVAQDAMTISCFALAIGLINKILDDKPVRKIWLFICAILLCVVVTSKPAYLPLVFILPVMFFNNKPQFKLSVMLSILICFVVFSWSWTIKSLVISADVGINPIVQMHFLISHLSMIPGLVINTLLNDGFYLRSFIGKIGWMDTTALPMMWCMLFYIGILFCVIIDNYYGVSAKKYFKKSCLLLLCLCTVLGIYVIAYLLWTTVGSQLIFGVQGRYFILIMFTLTLLFGKVNVQEMKVSSASRIVSLLGLAIFLFTVVDIIFIFSL